MIWTPIEEWMVKEGERHFGPASVFGKVLADAEEIRARGLLARFVISERGELAAQEGVPTSTTGVPK